MLELFGGVNVTVYRLFRFPDSIYSERQTKYSKGLGTKLWWAEVCTGLLERMQ